MLALSAMDAAFLALPTLHSEGVVFSAAIGQGEETHLSIIGQDSWKVPG